VQHDPREIFRFVVVGGFNAGTYFGLYSAGVLLGVPYLAAAVAAFFISASVGYWLHEHWTFKKSDPTARSWAAWVGAQAAGTGLNVALLAALVDGAGLDPIFAQALLMPVTPVATYLIGKRWVFS
jgi:putative flippase GtrA